jgi:DNA-binding IclR family transcriptional regulator
VRKPLDETRTAVGRALAILTSFDEAHRRLRLAQIARRVGLPAATAHRLLGELVDSHVLVRTPDGHYQIGAKTWHLGLMSEPARLKEAALPHLQDLVATTGHTVHLAILQGSGAMVVERLAGSRTVSTRHRPGAVLPLHCTAVGKALLAHAPEAIVRDVFGRLERHTAHTITDVRILERQLAAIRRAGIAVSAQEHRLRVSSLAAPILHGDELLAAVALIAPLTSARLPGTVPPLRATAATIAAAARQQQNTT